MSLNKKCHNVADVIRSVPTEPVAQQTIPIQSAVQHIADKKSVQQAPKTSNNFPVTVHELDDDFDTPIQDFKPTSQSRGIFGATSQNRSTTIKVLDTS